MYLLSKTGMAYLFRFISYLKKIDPIKRASVCLNIMLLSSVLSLITTDKPLPNNPMNPAITEIIDKYECQIDSLAHVSKIKSSSQTKVKSIKTPKQVRKSGLALDNFRIASNVNRFIDKAFHIALNNYTGPAAPLITSMCRPNCTSSKHHNGKAVDIHMDQHGRNMLEWLISFEGQKWRNENKVAFYIEDKPHSKRLVPFARDSAYQDFILKNKGATGLHLHVFAEN